MRKQPHNRFGRIIGRNLFSVNVVLAKWCKAHIVRIYKENEQKNMRINKRHQNELKNRSDFIGETSELAPREMG